MKASTILQWIVDDSISGEDLGFLDVPAEDDEFVPQNEEWWMTVIGGMPPAPIPEGKYLYFYGDVCDEISDEHGNVLSADAEVEITGNPAPVYLYRVED